MHDHQALSSAPVNPIHQSKSGPQPKMEFLAIAICIGTIPAFIAKSKGRDFVVWWLYGAALFIVALPHSLLIRPDVEEIERERLRPGNVRKCPACAEVIKAEARVCRFCGRDVPDYSGVDNDDTITRLLID